MILFCVTIAMRPSYRNVIRYVQILGGWVRVLDVRYRGYKPHDVSIGWAHSTFYQEYDPFSDAFTLNRVFGVWLCLT